MNVIQRLELLKNIETFLYRKRFILKIYFFWQLNILVRSCTHYTMVDFYESQNVTWIEAYLRHDEQTPSKIIFVSLSALNIILGTPVILAIISYERYGCDPQKRGLTNQV